MSRMAALGFLAALSLAPWCQAQQQAPARPDNASPDSTPVVDTKTAAAAPAAPAMTPRQVAEMRAEILMARKMYTEAIVIYIDLLSKQPKDAELANKMGIAYQQEGLPDAAGRCYKRAIKLDSKFASALNNLGTIEYEHKKYRKAIRLYQRALAVQPDLATLHGNLGYALFADKKYPEAMQSFQKAMALDPAVFDHKGGYGTLVQQRSMEEPGFFYFFVAKSYALAGDAEHCAHYLKMARDEGYKLFLSAQNDPTFTRVVADPRVQQVFHPEGPAAEQP
jgi:tetratricopeptide (TPR) repeat protein